MKHGYLGVLIVGGAINIAGCGTEDAAPTAPSQTTSATSDSPSSPTIFATPETAAVPLPRRPDVPLDYVFIPGGWTHPSCVHEVPNGATIDADRGDVLMDGKVVAHYEACAFAPIHVHLHDGMGTKSLISAAGTSAMAMPAPTTGGLVGPAYGGWVEDTMQMAPAGQSFGVVQTIMTVPQTPVIWTPQTLYFFPGLESTLDSNCGIIQPVLQWGVSPAGGGQFWAIGSWWWSNTMQFHSTLSTVNVTDGIQSTMYHSAANWLVQAYDRATGATQAIHVTTACRFNQAFPATFEVDGGAPITSCNQVPGSISFTNIALATGLAPFTSVAYAPTAQFPIGSSSPNCGWWMSWNTAPPANTTLGM